jgi:hypothetical protein
MCALVSCGVERRVSSWAQFQSGIYSGFCLLLLQSFCSWLRHFKVGCMMDFIQILAWLVARRFFWAPSLDDGVFRTWTDSNWIWHSLTNSGTIWLMPDWYRDLGGISLYYWPILGFAGLQQQIVNQCVGPRNLSQRQEAKQLPQQRNVQEGIREVWTCRRAS